MTIQIQKIPEALKNLKQWVNWKLITKANDKPTKVPFQTDGKPASSMDSKSWNNFTAVSLAADKFSGIGFVFSKDDPFCGIDFDACRDPKTKIIEPWAKDWIRKFNSYSEVSPSETGVKVWIIGKLPFESGKKSLLPQFKSGDKIPAVEAYDHGRYFAVTGDRYDSLPHEPQERQEILNQFCAEFFKPESGKSSSESSRMSVIERAGRYLDTIPGGVSGQNGHDQTFKAACALVQGFNLTKSEAFVLMLGFNNRCEPKWNEKELRHKLDSADRQTGERGYLSKAKESEWASVKMPEYKDSIPAPDQKESIGRSEPTVITLQDSVDKYLEKITTTKESLLCTGLDQVDYALGGGVDQHEMVIVAARPSHGKSAYALQALNAAAFMGHTCAIISEEMSAIALGKRTVQYVSETRECDWIGKIEHVRGEIKQHFAKQAPCYVVEGCGSAERACDALKKLHDTKGVTVAAIDYAQLLTSRGRSRYEEITQTSITIRQLASATNMTLYVLCQLSRGIESRDKFVPRIDDLKDSGQLEQDADVIMFLVWPWKIDSTKNPEYYEVWIGKNRNRPINAHEVDCRFNPARQMILTPRINNVITQQKWNYGGE
jgi:replicative DNA helicase